MRPRGAERRPPEACRPLRGWSWWAHFYEIRLGSCLDPWWAAWFDGMTLTAATDGTVLTSTEPDQAALHGVLRQIRDLGLPLLAVTRLGPDLPHPSPATPHRPGRTAT